VLLLKIVMRLFEPRQALVLLRRRKAESDPGREKRLVVAAIAHPKDDAKLGMEIDFDEGCFGFAAQAQLLVSREDLRKENVTTTNRLIGKTLSGFDFDLVSPMVSDGETVGVIAVAEPQELSNAAKTVLRLVSQIGAVAVQNVLGYYQMKRSADMDALTGLFCKGYMHVALGDLVVQALQNASRLSVFFFDIDNFKNYNDVNGHGAGDTLLQMLAKLVGENTRRSNILGRVGGEEFLLIMPDTAKAQALTIAEKLRSIISSHDFPFADRQPLGVVSISGGVASYPEDSLDSAGLLREADQALYQAKGSGRNRVLAAEPQYLGVTTSDQ
jgi:diguanylate cyclase (GGDEF)-like protein